MQDASSLLAAYDDQLRSEAETPTAIAVTRLGPLRLVSFARGRGFVTYRDLGGADAADIARWVEGAHRHFTNNSEFRIVEWKTRGHDHAPGLHDALVAHGFIPEEPESIMVGEVRSLVSDVALPEGVTLRTIDSPDDVARMCAMQAEVFAGVESDAMTQALLRRLALKDGMSLWIAEAGGRDRHLGPTGACPRHGVCRHLGRRHARRMARERHLSRIDLGAGSGRVGRREDADPQRLHRFLTTHPGSGRTGEGVNNDALCMEARADGFIDLGPTLDAASDVEELTLASNLLGHTKEQVTRSFAQ